MAMAIAALLLAALAGVVDRALGTDSFSQTRNAATGDGRFAMQRMVDAVTASRSLILPLADNPATPWREHVREQTIPASAPESGSAYASAVLAVTQDPTRDIDLDGIADADNDGDGRVDEDASADQSNDGASGIVEIDDDGDGLTDESVSGDDDEDGSVDEDARDGGDGDGDGGIDEDPAADTNGDGRPGILGEDDDGDGNTDEGQTEDDDEDGLRDEDWPDAVVFFLSGSTLFERQPNPGATSGNDFTEFAIADNVTAFRVERLPDAGRRATLVDITLTLTPDGGAATTLNTRVRIGAGL